MATDVRKLAQDAAYVAVGVGVLGFQRAQVARREARSRLESQVKETRDQIKGTRDKVSTGVQEAGAVAITTARTTAQQARTRLETLTAEARSRVEPLAEQVRSRVEPLAEQVQGRIPESLNKLVEVGKSRLGGQASSAA